MAQVPDLLATCWTSAGDLVPGRNGDVSPLTVEERVAAVAKAGYRGFGIAAPDLAVVRDTIGYPALAQLLDENGLRHVEVEYLQDWWTRGNRRRASDRVREVLFEAAAELGADHVKVGLGDREDALDEERFAGEFDRLATEAHAPRDPGRVRASGGLHDEDDRPRRRARAHGRQSRRRSSRGHLAHLPQRNRLRGARRGAAAGVRVRGRAERRVTRYRSARSTTTPSTTGCRPVRASSTWPVSSAL